MRRLMDLLKRLYQKYLLYINGEEVWDTYIVIKKEVSFVLNNYYNVFPHSLFWVVFLRANVCFFTAHSKNERHIVDGFLRGAKLCLKSSSQKEFEISPGMTTKPSRNWQEIVYFQVLSCIISVWKGVIEFVWLCSVFNGHIYHASTLLATYMDLE